MPDKDHDPIGRSGLEHLARMAPPMKRALADAEPTVVSTAWTKHFSDRWWLDPEHMRRSGHVPGKDLSRRPRKLGFYEEHGYDASGRVRVSRRHTRGFHETQVMSYSAGLALAIVYSSDITHAVEFVARYAVADDSRVLSAEQLWHRGQYELEYYIYDDAGRVVRVEVERTERPNGPRAGLPHQRGVQHITYDGADVTTVTETDALGRTQVLFASATSDASSRVPQVSKPS